VARALLAAAGPAAGGLLSAADLEETLPGDEPARFKDERGLGVALPPWQVASGRPAHVVVAADASGLCAVLAFSPDEDGIEVPELELSMPRDAKPVRRGVPRTAPGTALAAALPIALLRRRKDGWFAAVGVRGTEPLRAEPLHAAAVDGDDSLAARLDAWRAGGIALAAATERRRVQLTRVGASD
jgi:gamma-glutamyltranspeptidase/glutathione hydrolase